jgi:hypothetical protein
MSDLLELVTGLTEKEQKKIFTWVASLPVPSIIDIFQDAVKKSFQIKAERPGMQGKETKYCAFILAARNAGWDTVQGKGYRVAGEKQYGEFDHLRKTAVATMVRKGRTPILRKKITAYWGEVKVMKEEGLGFRPIAEYLSKKRKIKVSVTYLKMLWKEIEES